MEQLSFFAEAGKSKGLPPELLEYRPALIDQAPGDQLLRHFIDTAPWKQSIQKMLDKEYPTPRLTGWYGNVGTDYSLPRKISRKVY